MKTEHFKPTFFAHNKNFFHYKRVKGNKGTKESSLINQKKITTLSKIRKSIILNIKTQRKENKKVRKQEKG